MEYSIQQLARLSGLTARTLRWYDQIGLLRPARVAESGYRYYGPAQVDRLQDILYYRALGVELGHIRELLDDPSFDRLDALRRHLEKLRAQQARLDALIRSVEKTIGCEERRENMNDAEKFEALKRQAVAENEAAYGQEARTAYGDSAVDAANSRFLGMDKTTHDAWTEQDARLRAGLEAGGAFARKRDRAGTLRPAPAMAGRHDAPPDARDAPGHCGTVCAGRAFHGLL